MISIYRTKKGQNRNFFCLCLFLQTLTDYAYLFIYCSCLLPATDTESKAYRHEFGFSTVQYGILFFIFFPLTILKKHLFTSFHRFTYSLIQDLLLSKILIFFHNILQKLALDKQFCDLCTIFHFKQAKNKLKYR